MTNNHLEELRSLRFHVEGQTSTVGRRWQIWDNKQGRARFCNIADEGDAVAICRELNTRPESESVTVMREALEWLAAFADIRAKDDSKTFARINRGALRTISAKAHEALARIGRS